MAITCWFSHPMLLETKADNIIGSGGLKIAVTTSNARFKARHQRISTKTILVRSSITSATLRRLTINGLGIRHASRYGNPATLQTKSSRLEIRSWSPQTTLSMTTPAKD
jgi:hypothetical protein